ncbi:hypothetical protein EJB05_15320, partial [Eragrostis curvula]
MESAVQILASSVGQLLAEEYRQLRGVGGQVVELRDELAAMNAVLRMQSEAEEGDVDLFIREMMKQVRELAFDSEVCVDEYIFCIKSRPSDGLRAFLARLLSTLRPRRRLAGEINALRSRAISISERHARYGQYAVVKREAPPFSALRLAFVPARARYRDQFTFVGDKAATVAELVKSCDIDDDDDDDERRRLKVFYVIGFGGVGKTTLAMEVCRLLEPDFPYQAFVSVSRAFEPRSDLKLLIKRVLQQIAKSKRIKERGVAEEIFFIDIDLWDTDMMAKKLKYFLEHKR